MFTWVWTGPRSGFELFKKALRYQATEDGYYVGFTDLHGSDDSGIMRGAQGEGDGSVISSDVTRPSKILARPHRPWQVEGWHGWHKTLPAALPDKDKAPGDCPQWPCWICYQLTEIFLEYFEDGFE
jgi:hypothetical protein